MHYAKHMLRKPPKTAIGLDQHACKDIALIPGGAWDSLCEIVRQCFAKLAMPIQPLLQLLVLLGKTNRGSRTIAILHTTYRLTVRLISAHVSLLDVKFPGKWDSALWETQHSEPMLHVLRVLNWPTQKVNM